MTSLKNRLATDERAATSIEYGLLVAVIALSLLSATTPLVQSVRNLWGDNSGKVTKVSDAMPA